MFTLSFLISAIFFAAIAVTNAAGRWEIKVGGYKYKGDDAWMGGHAYLEIDQGDGYKYHHLLWVKDSSARFAIGSSKELGEKFFTKTGALFKLQSFNPPLYTTYTKAQLVKIGNDIINGRPQSPFGYNCMHFILQYVRAIAEPGSFHGHWPPVFQFFYTHYLNDKGVEGDMFPTKVDPEHPIDLWEKGVKSDSTYLTSRWPYGPATHCTATGVRDDEDDYYVQNFRSDVHSVKDLITANLGEQTGWARHQVLVGQAGDVERKFVRPKKKHSAGGAGPSK